MDDILAFGLPALAVALAIFGMIAVRQSAKSLKQKLESERRH